MLLDQQYIIVIFPSQVPALPAGDTPGSDHALPVCCTVTSRRPPRSEPLLGAAGFPVRSPNSKSTVLSDISPTPRLHSRSVLWGRSQPFPLGNKNAKSSTLGHVFISCSVGLGGELGLFTQILVERRLQEPGVGVVLHQAVHPLLGCGKAATRSLLNILGDERFGLKVYVYLQ